MLIPELIRVATEMECAGQLFLGHEFAHDLGKGPISMETHGFLKKICCSWERRKGKILEKIPKGVQSLLTVLGLSEPIISIVKSA